MIQSTCNLCNKPYQIDDSAAGIQIQCPSCGQTIVAGAPAPAPAASPVPPSGAPGTGSPGVVWAGQGQRPREHQPGYKRIMAWIYTALTALVCTLLIHGLLAFISIKFKLLPAWVIMYLPIVPGLLAGASIFMNEGLKNSPTRMPLLFTALGIALSTLLSAGPALLMEAIYKSSIKKEIITTITQQTSPPHFIIGGQTVSLMSVTLGKVGKNGVCQINATYSNNKTYELQIKRNVSQMTDFTGVPEMKARMIMDNHLKPLAASLHKYSALKTAKVEKFSISKQTKPGYYHATASLSSGFDVNMIVQAIKQSMRFALTRESAREVSAIPKVTKIWKKFDATGKSICSKVTVGKNIDSTHWNATAFFSSGKEMPIFLQETITNNMAIVRVFFPAKETSILKINNIINATGSFGGRIISEQCVNLKETRALRTDETDMQALFVEEAPADVVINKQGLDVRVIPGKWQVFTSNQNGNKLIGWSTLAPKEYSLAQDSKDRNIRTATFKSTSKGKKVDIAFSLNAKEFSDVSRFSLSDYVTKERSDWTTKYPMATATDLSAFKTYSGLKGYTYTATHGSVFRCKYFFIKKNDLAILTFDDLNAAQNSQELSNQIALTLRHKDNPDETLAKK